MTQWQLYLPKSTPAFMMAHRSWEPAALCTTCRQLNRLKTLFQATQLVWAALDSPYCLYNIKEGRVLQIWPGSGSSWGFLAIFLPSPFPLVLSRVQMSLLSKVVGLKELWRKFPHNSPTPFLFPIMVPWPFLILHWYGLILHTYLLDTWATLSSELLLSFWALGKCDIYFFLAS